MVYNIPYRTGVAIELNTMLRLAGHPNIRAVKDCSGAVDKTQTVDPAGLPKIEGRPSKS